MPDVVRAEKNLLYEIFVGKKAIQVELTISTTLDSFFEKDVVVTFDCSPPAFVFSIINEFVIILLWRQEQGVFWLTDFRGPE